MKTEERFPPLEDHRDTYSLIKPLKVQLHHLPQREWTQINQKHPRELGHSLGGRVLA